MESETDTKRADSIIQYQIFFVWSSLQYATINKILLSCLSYCQFQHTEDANKVTLISYMPIKLEFSSISPTFISFFVMFFRRFSTMAIMEEILYWLKSKSTFYA